MKKFIEDDFKVDYKSPLSAIQSVVVMLLTAPFKLVMTISSKILYLPKEAIIATVRNSFVVSFVVTVAVIAGELYMKKFSLFTGKVPVIMLAAVTVFLAFLYVGANAVDLSAYSELKVLLGQMEEEEVEPASPSLQPEEELKASLPLQTGEDETIFMDDLYSEDLKDDEEGEQASLQQVTTSPQQATMQVTSLPQQTTVQVTSPLKQQVSVKIAEKFDYDKMNAGASLPEDSLKALIGLLEKSTNPSEFLSESLLEGFKPEEEVADDSNLECLSLGIIPNSFKALA